MTYRIVDQSGKVRAETSDVDRLAVINSVLDDDDKEGPYAWHPDDVAAVKTAEHLRTFAPLTARQFDAMLRLMQVVGGRRSAAMETAIDAKLDNPAQRSALKSWVAEGDVYHRDHAFMAMLIEALELKVDLLNIAWAMAADMR